MAATRPVQVLVVDDSAFMRKVLTGILEDDPEINIAGTARDGMDAVEKAITLRPDVITLDVEMPRLNGLAALQQIMEKAPCAVVMVSSLTQRGAAITVQALAAGAIDFVTKPSGAISLDLYRLSEELKQKVKLAARTPKSIITTNRRYTRTAQPQGPGPASAMAPRTGSSIMPWLIVLASSTGGPGVLYQLLGMLPPHLNSSILIVQHMPVGFTAPLAEHLNRVAHIPVKEATGGERLQKGQALIAPGGKHMVIGAGDQIELNEGPNRHGVRPSADVTLESVPSWIAKRTIALILTGMGSDGAAGANVLRGKGAQIWVQDEASCVVFGMPQATLQLGAVDRIGTPEQLATWLIEHTGGGKN